MSAATLLNVANITLLSGQEEGEFLRYKPTIMKRLFYILMIIWIMVLSGV